jgi:hypothetical protein
MLMIYVIKVARYACGEDAHVLTNRFLMPCNHVLFYLFVSKHKEKKIKFEARNFRERKVGIPTPESCGTNVSWL